MEILSCFSLVLFEQRWPVTGEVPLEYPGYVTDMWL